MGQGEREDREERSDDEEPLSQRAASRSKRPRFSRPQIFASLLDIAEMICGLADTDELIDSMDSLADVQAAERPE